MDIARRRHPAKDYFFLDPFILFTFQSFLYPIISPARPSVGGEFETGIWTPPLNFFDTVNIDDAFAVASSTTFLIRIWSAWAVLFSGK